MKKVRWLSAAAGTALVAATFALPGAGVAYASGNGNITGNGNLSLLSGNTVNAPISAPVNLCGVSLAVLGFANSGCAGGATSNVSDVGGGSDNGNVTGNNNLSLGSGNTVNTPVSAPVNICGISGAVAGYANSHCKGGATSTISGVGGGSGHSGSHSGSHNGNVTGNFNVPVLSGNTVNAPVSAPVNICGISLALLGFSNAGCAGGATSNVSGVDDGSHNGNVTGNFNVPVGSGNTVNAPVSAPVNICSVAGAVAGYANSQCEGGSTSCIGDQCGQPSCHDRDCTPCQGWDCHMPPPCYGSDCHMPPPCHGNDCHMPPPCQGNCTPPTGPGAPHGAGPGTTTTVTTSTTPGSTGLPTTGADLLLLGIAAIGSIGVGVGAGTVALARRRRNGEAS